MFILGYAVISHAFDHYLYPDEAFREQLYTTATIDTLWFDLLLILTTLVIVVGWMKVYYAGHSRSQKPKRFKGIRLRFYALISREFYLLDLYSWLARTLLQLAARLNVLLKWR